MKGGDIIKKISILIIVLLVSPVIINFPTIATDPGQIYQGTESILYRNVTVYAPAVARTEDSYVGVISTITVTIQSNGSGRVFVDTLPLTEVDMQGSARLAVKVASALVRSDENSDVDPSTFDYFFVVRTDAPIIGGPSAGGIMTVATIALLMNWNISNSTVMTGMINPDGSIGPIGGIKYKVDAAYSVGATRFLIPKGQGTYTEMVTETVNNNGWITTQTKPVTINVADYAWENYNIEIQEVEEINDALEYFTGWTFTYEESDEKITTEDYITSMKPLATMLLENATTSYEEANTKFANSSIPNSFPTYHRNNVYEELEKAELYLTGAEDWYDEGLYYSSTSKSFQSLIYSRFVSYASDFFEPENDEYLEELLSSVQSIYDNATANAKNAEIKGYITLQSVGAAQRRASEAHSEFDEAKIIYKSISTYSDVLNFLERIAFVVERCKSIGWWLDIGTKFNDTGNIENNTVENLALEYIEEAQQAVTYSGVLLEEMGSSYIYSNEYLNEALKLLEISRDDLDNNRPAAALFEALDALIKANVAIELIGTSAEEKIEFTRERASNNIAKARGQGIEPVLAVSYYEFAESLSNESSYESALNYYKYSGTIAGVLDITNINSGITSSRYVGIIETRTPEEINWFEHVGFLISLLALGVIAGIGIGLIVSGIYSQKEKENKTKETKPKIKKTLTYPDGKIPRSIRDYYKKNK